MAMLLAINIRHTACLNLKQVTSKCGNGDVAMFSRKYHYLDDLKVLSAVVGESESYTTHQSGLDAIIETTARLTARSITADDTESSEDEDLREDLEECKRQRRLAATR